MTKANAAALVHLFKVQLTFTPHPDTSLTFCRRYNRSDAWWELLWRPDFW
jgi:hypothetical protein